MSENIICVKTLEQFKEFCKNNYCFYEYGFGYSIVQMISTEEEFIEFMLKCGVNEENQPYFLSDCDFDYLNVNRTFINDEYMCGYEFNEDDFEYITAYSIYYNSYDYNPFEFYKIKNFKKIKSSLFSVPDEIKNKFPFVVKFISQDTFDRMGNIKGCNIEIFPLKDIDTMIFV